jgi:hypothetical protein
MTSLPPSAAPAASPHTSSSPYHSAPLPTIDGPTSETRVPLREPSPAMPPPSQGTAAAPSSTRNTRSTANPAGSDARATLRPSSPPQKPMTRPDSTTEATSPPPLRRRWRLPPPWPPRRRVTDTTAAVGERAEAAGPGTGASAARGEAVLPPPPPMGPAPSSTQRMPPPPPMGVVAADTGSPQPRRGAKSGTAPSRRRHGHLFHRCSSSECPMVMLRGHL